MVAVLTSRINVGKKTYIPKPNNLVSLKTVQGVTYVRDMETMANHDLLAVERDDGRVITEDRSERVITHADLTPQDWIVRDKGRFVWDHVVSYS